MTIKCYKYIVLIIVGFFSYPSAVLSAMNFEGAIIENRDVPTTAWRYGITGNKLVVLIVNDKSKAKQIGFKTGDIIISVDDKEGVSYKDLTELPVGKHIIKVFNKKFEVENLVLNIIPKITETTKQYDKDSNLPSVVVNDDALANKYGKSEVKNKKKRNYQECMDDELANANTYDYYLNKPNARGGDYGRAQRICDEEFGRRTGISIERLY